MEESDDIKYYSLIADYLDEKMSADEEIAFMEMVSSNPRLRELYEQNLNMGWILADQKVDSEPIKETQKIFTIHNKFKKVFLFAAASLILFSGLGVFKYIFNSKEDNKLVEKKNNAPEIEMNEPNDSSLTHTQESNTVNYQQIFKKYYSRYQNQFNDPVEISYYYEAYKNKRYAEVINAQPADYALLGEEADSDRVASFMNFYKLIARFEKGDTSLGNEFYELSRSTPIKEIKEISLWYGSLSFLKENKTVLAIDGFEKISKSQNNTKKAAAIEILLLLKLANHQ